MRLISVSISINFVERPEAARKTISALAICANPQLAH